MVIFRSTLVFCASFASIYAQLQPELPSPSAKPWETLSSRVPSSVVAHKTDTVKLRDQKYGSLLRRSSALSLQRSNLTSNFTSELRNDTFTKAASAAGLGVVFGQNSPAVDGSSVSQGSSVTQSSTVDALEPILTRYAQFSSIAYAAQCAKPNGADLVQYFGASSSGLDYSEPSGYVAFDTDKAEVIVAFRGDPSLQSVPSAANAGPASSLVRPSIATLQGQTDLLLNVDFLSLFGNISSTLAQVITAVSKLDSKYTITFTGHGVGGALASIAAVVFAGSSSGNNQVQLVTFGSPRVGNDIWANYSDSVFSSSTGTRALRVTKAGDNMPQLLALKNGYRHTSFEIYESSATNALGKLSQCTGQEDIHCSLGEVLSSLTSTTDDTTNNNNQRQVTAASNPQVTAASEPQINAASNSQADNDDTGSTEPLTVSSCSTCLGMECIDCFQNTADSSGTNAQIVPGAGTLGSGLATPDATSESNSIGLASNQAQSADATSSLLGSQIFTEILPDGSTRSFIIPIVTSLGSDLSNAQLSLGDSSPYADGPGTSTSASSNSGTKSVLKIPVYQFHANLTVDNQKAYMNASTELKRRTTSVQANDAHLTYLGIRMTQDGPSFCSATASTTTPGVQGSIGLTSAEATCYSPPSTLACVIFFTACFLIV